MACGYLLALIHLGNCTLAALKMVLKLNEFGSCFAYQHARPLGHVPLQHGPQFAGLLSQVNSCVVCVGCLSPFPSGKLGSMPNARLRCTMAMAARGDWAWGAGGHTAGCCETITSCVACGGRFIGKGGTGPLPSRWDTRLHRTTKPAIIWYLGYHWHLNY